MQTNNTLTIRFYDQSFLSLASLRYQKDLEGQFCSGNHPECNQLKDYLLDLDSIDYYFSLHATNYATPGAFFYLNDLPNRQAKELSSTLSESIPLLDYDPTGMATTNLSSGLFPLPTATRMSDMDSKERSQTSMEFVAENFKSKMIGITEVPLGLFNIDTPATLDDICNVTFGNQDIKDKMLFREIDLQSQVEIIKKFVLNTVQLSLQS